MSKGFLNVIVAGLTLTSFACEAIESIVSSGADSSGGGKAVVCRESNGAVKSIELLDLFEGRAIYGLEIKSLGPDMEANIAQVRIKFSEVFKDASFTLPMDHWIDLVRKNFRLLPPGVALEPVDDALEIALPVGCTTEQLALYKDETLVLVNQDLWNLLDAKNKAALFAHEAVYRVDRMRGEVNSQHARKVVAHLFSEFKFVPILQGIPKGAMVCTTQLGEDEFNAQFQFYKYDAPDDPHASILQFVYIRNRVPFSKTTMTSLRWHWDNRYSDIYMQTRSNLETFEGLLLRRQFDQSGAVTGYYFDEPDGKHMIHCW